MDFSFIDIVITNIPRNSLEKANLNILCYIDGWAAINTTFNPK